MASVNAVMAHPPLQTPIARRKGDYHPNLWNDCFIQSLSSPYSASSNHERRETLCMEIKDRLKELGNAESNPTADNLVERFWTVDTVQCLGIGRHFQKEIKLILDYCYKYWKEEGITLDLNAAALGFRTLRLNGYHVSADVFNAFKDDDGQFFCPVATKETHCESRSLLSFHRASELVFPGETILKEANIFTTKYLQHVLNEWKESKLDKNQLIMEVEYALKYPWRYNVPRWEARNYIEIFRQDKTSSVKDGDFNKTIFELAILDFNIVQAQHQSELKEISRWWNDSSVRQLDFFRQRYVEFYLWSACGLFEKEFAPSRIVFSKLDMIITVLDDIYDTHGTLDELKLFTPALISLDMSTTDNLPDYMKISFKFVLETFKDIQNEVEKKQGHIPNIMKYIQHCWENYILSYLEDAKWIHSNYIPTLDEYFIKYGPTSTGFHLLSIYSFLVMDTILSEKIFKEIDFPSSKFETIMPTIGRLINDSKCFQGEEDRGDCISILTSFKRDNPQSTLEDAFNYVNNLLERYMEDLTMEFLESSYILASYKKFYYNVCVRGTFFMYKDGDGFSVVDQEIKNAISQILIEPIPL